MTLIVLSNTYKQQYDISQHNLIPFIFPYHFNEPLYNPNAKKGNKIKRQTHYHNDSNNKCKDANFTVVKFLID